MTITLRQETATGATTKGSTLTYAELDNTVIDLLQNKIIPLQVNADTGAVTVGEAQSNGVFAITGGTNIATTVTEDSAGNANLTIATSNTITADDFVGSLNGQIRAQVKAGEDISKGEAVYFSGLSGNNPIANLARSNSSTTMPAMGIAAEDIANTAVGEITVFGPQKGLDVADFGEGSLTFALGDVVYVSSTEAGQLTNVVPTGETNLIQNIGKIARIDPTTNSTIFVGGAGRTNATPNLDNDQFFKGNGSNQSVAVDFTAAVQAVSINNVSEDASPQLGGTLDAQSNNFTNVGTINTHTIPGGSGTIALTSDIPAGGDSIQAGDNITISTPDSAGGKTISFKNPFDQPLIGGDQTLSQINFKDYSETVYTGGTSTGTITPDVVNGNVQSITLTGSITLNAFNSPAAGQSMTMIVQQPASGGPYTLTSTMKFAGGTKTLSTGANEYDIITIFYDGTNYFASLSTNFS